MHSILNKYCFILKGFGKQWRKKPLKRQQNPTKILKNVGVHPFSIFYLYVWSFNWVKYIYTKYYL